MSGVKHMKQSEKKRAVFVSHDEVNIFLRMSNIIGRLSDEEKEKIKEIMRRIDNV